MIFGSGIAVVGKDGKIIEWFAKWKKKKKARERSERTFKYCPRENRKTAAMQAHGAMDTAELQGVERLESRP